MSFKLENQAEYCGETQKNKEIRHGRGIQVWIDGSRYEGYWINNKANKTIKHITVHSIIPTTPPNILEGIPNIIVAFKIFSNRFVATFNKLNTNVNMNNVNKNAITSYNNILITSIPLNIPPNAIGFLSKKASITHTMKPTALTNSLVKPLLIPNNVPNNITNKIIISIMLSPLLLYYIFVKK